tara:strand:- start:9574 stop:10542 length:969 start_codon:yes stop_codon:yes gene_type:complete
MSLETVRTLLKDDMEEVNDLIMRRLYSRVELVSEVGQYIVDSGGKRTRPMLVLLAAKAFGYRGEMHIELATIIEFIHTATLLHDDVVDGSLLRRGLDTANAVWGSQASVLVGDFLYSRSFQMMVSLKNMQVMDILANTTNVISEGEVLQLINANDPDTTEARYLDVIRCKTAELFRAATQLGAVAADRSEAEITAMANYGLHLGMAYQLVDDILDYSSDAATMGKNIGDDLAEGKPTLPLIYVMKHGTPQQIKLIRDAITEGGIDALAEIQQAIADTNALDYCRQVAESEKQRAIFALENIPDSIHKDAMIELVEFVLKRDH